jgi:ABC-type oligopeptide transport system substrate-binding subunit
VLEKAKGIVSDTAFKALNDSTLRVYLNEPFIAFTELLSMPYAYVVPKEAVQKYGKDFREHPVGTGPFQFQTLGRRQCFGISPKPKLLEER